MSKIPRIALNNGTMIPQLGIGTLHMQPDRTASPSNIAQTAEIVGKAFDVGYRHIDTAQSYGTERGVGAAIAASGIPREEIYITSKLANGNHRPDDVRRTFDDTLANLGLDYLDLFLIHWPVPTLYDGDYVSTWKAIVELLANGRLRTAGVSNFQPAHLDRIIAETGVVPAVNQFEIHPYFANGIACAATTRHGSAIEAHSPLGHGRLFDEPVISRIATARERSSAQVILRWHIQHGRIIIPKSSRRERMVENLDAFDFELSVEEVAAIDALDKGEGGRMGPDPDTWDRIL